jgi:hypothetical protein
LPKKGKKKSDEQLLEETRARFRRLVEELLQKAKEKVDALEAASKKTPDDDRLKDELKAALQDLEDTDVLFIGLDCGKSGLNAAMAPRVIRMEMMNKAKAEAELFKAREYEDASAIATAEEKVKKTTLSEEKARQLFENAQVPSESSSHPNEQP